MLRHHRGVDIFFGLIGPGGQSSGLHLAGLVVVEDALVVGVAQTQRFFEVHHEGILGKEEIAFPGVGTAVREEAVVLKIFVPSVVTLHMN